MKQPTILIFLLSIYFSSISIAGNSTNDWKRLALRGKVSQLTETKWVFSGSGENIKSQKTITVSCFDRNGMLKSVTEYDSLNHKTGKTCYLYDKNRNKIKVIEYYATGDIAEKTTYKYDKENRLIDERVWRRRENPADSRIQRTWYEYSEAGDSAIVYQFDDTGVLLSKSIRQKNANKLIELSYNTDDSLFTQNVFRFTPDSLISEALFYDASGILTSKTVYTYDSIQPGYLLKREMFKRVNSEMKFVLLTHYGYYNDLLAEEGESDFDAGTYSLRTYSYSTDKHDNWTLFTDFQNEMIVLKIERKIKYY